MIKINAYGQDFGKLTYFKHTQIKSGPKTDGSDGITYLAPFGKKFGGGTKWLWSEVDIKPNSVSGETKIKSRFDNIRPDMFPDASSRYKAVRDWDGVIPVDTVIIDTVIIDPPIDSLPCDSISQVKLKEIRDGLEALETQADLLKSAIRRLKEKAKLD